MDTTASALAKIAAHNRALDSDESFGQGLRILLLEQEPSTAASSSRNP
jgi:hypothetical protein